MVNVKATWSLKIKSCTYPRIAPKLCRNQLINQHKKNQFIGFYFIGTFSASDAQGSYSSSGLNNLFYQRQEIYFLQNNANIILLFH